MKYMFMILFLGIVGCESAKEEKDCKFKPIATVGALAVSNKYKCDKDKVEMMFLKGLENIGLCENVEKGLHYSALSARNISCSIVPAVVSAGESFGMAYLECKKDFNLEKAVRKALKCD